MELDRLDWWGRAQVPCPARRGSGLGAHVLAASLYYMGRPSKFSSNQILDTASRLLACDGPGSLSVASIAASLRAPSGSIYHRFGSRDILVAELWLRAVERFHKSLTPWLEITNGFDAIRAIAVGVVSWTRDNPLEAHLLLLHRSSDLLHDGWPPELSERNLAQRARSQALIESLCQRVGATTPGECRRVVFAAVDVPYAAVRSYLSSGIPPPDDLIDLVADAVNGVLTPLKQPTKGKT